MELPTDEMLVLVKYDKPETVAFVNLYNPGDLWLKVQGCEACTPEGVRNCCGKCPFRLGSEWLQEILTSLGVDVPPLDEKGRCIWHVEGRRSRKPFVCIVDPHPRHACSYCQLVFECVQGPKKGKKRHVCDKRDELR